MKLMKMNDFLSISRATFTAQVLFYWSYSFHSTQTWNALRPSTRLEKAFSHQTYHRNFRIYLKRKWNFSILFHFISFNFFPFASEMNINLKFCSLLQEHTNRPDAVGTFDLLTNLELWNGNSDSIHENTSQRNGDLQSQLTQITDELNQLKMQLASPTQSASKTFV